MAGMLAMPARQYFRWKCLFEDGLGGPLSLWANHPQTPLKTNDRAW